MPKIIASAPADGTEPTFILAVSDSVPGTAVRRRPEAAVGLEDFDTESLIQEVLGMDKVGLEDEWVGVAWFSWERDARSELGFPESNSFGQKEKKPWREWVARPGNGERFERVVRDEFQAARDRLRAVLTQDGRIRLIAVVPYKGDLASDLAAGKADLASAHWMWNHSPDPEWVAQADVLSVPPGVETDGDWDVFADFEQTDVDWRSTFTLMVGYYDFEHQVRVRDGASPAAVVSVRRRPD